MIHIVCLENEREENAENAKRYVNTIDSMLRLDTRNTKEEKCLNSLNIEREQQIVKILTLRKSHCLRIVNRFTINFGSFHFPVNGIQNQHVIRGIKAHTASNVLFSFLFLFAESRILIQRMHD